MAGPPGKHGGAEPGVEVKLEPRRHGLAPCDMKHKSGDRGDACYGQGKFWIAKGQHTHWTRIHGGQREQRGSEQAWAPKPDDKAGKKQSKLHGQEPGKALPDIHPRRQPTPRPRAAEQAGKLACPCVDSGGPAQKYHGYDRGIDEERGREEPQEDFDYFTHEHGLPHVKKPEPGGKLFDILRTVFHVLRPLESRHAM